MQNNIALQLYSLRELTAKDPLAGLQLAAELGFKNVELAGTYGYTAKEFAAVLSNYGLKPVSAHIAVNAAPDDLKRRAEELNLLDCDACVCPCPPTAITTPEGCEQALTQILAAQKIFQSAGIAFGYHNHDSEFNPLPNGTRFIDLVVQSGILLQPDVYWVQFAGVDPYRFIEQHTGKILSLHFKEIDENGNNVELGTGILNWQRLNELGKTAGAAYNILEQEEYTLPLTQSITLCAQNLKKLFPGAKIQ